MVNHAKTHLTTDDLLWLPADFGVLVHGHLQQRLGSLLDGKHFRVCDPNRGLHMHNCVSPVSVLQNKELWNPHGTFCSGLQRPGKVPWEMHLPLILWPVLSKF